MFSEVKGYWHKWNGKHAKAASCHTDGAIFSDSHADSRALFYALVTFTVMICAAVFSAATGTVSIEPLTVLKVISHHIIGIPEKPTWSAHIDAIVWLARMPRIIMAMASGMILAIAGAVLQAIVRNPLADPYILGVNSGASVGAALILSGFGVSVAGGLYLSGAAFVGAILAMLLVLLITGTSRANSFRLIMAGLAVGYGLNSVTSFLIFASDSPEASRSIMFWLMGSLASIHWETAIITGCSAPVFYLLIRAFSKHLDAIASGDETAISVGVSVEKTRLILMVIVSLGIGVVVAGAGSIGFVGLIIPHFARKLVGSNHSAMLLVSAFLGGSFLLVADMGARLLFAPHEMAIGVLTGVVGAPFLLLILRSSNSRKV
ncbi:putative ABC-type Fe3+-siderophore transport system, permease component [Vibrio nigripulchritudo SO65]|uniref:FecCD family ABC transporter permease n=1 Tax=Vibrio nigripulchritudo TaxID=28173 RepID=UPI0003B20723|nr:iron ABC transporter permease [Vibrio nigripulchritudo]CCN38543.1 putative ABC-type Fe3+-siderophore transport system, permease component [Vibrio nigripulchritudo AM115]CCN43066.1 putative ABC-type Fe3+-siderophore transport system, permease component [Vibrio nigripulchritudo FTn2]CCN67429.1 putative ABC-type Fe3+-siderophore transport system, permease component [Vibrio nigripulchritudo POn4]CCN77176.1 putative ABC-type Fe3+-siderophore transport system, permease component [Vibrio nigripulch